jgi:thioredoxin
MAASTSTSIPSSFRWGRRHRTAAVLLLGFAGCSFAWTAAADRSAPPAPPSAAVTGGGGAAAAPPFVGERQFKRLIRSDVPVVVEFWARWCVPCRRASADLARFAAVVGPRAVVVRVDIDRDGYVAYRYGVASLPTVIVFRGGEQVRRSTGVVGVEGLEVLVAAAEASGSDAAPAAAVDRRGRR